MVNAPVGSTALLFLPPPAASESDSDFLLDDIEEYSETPVMTDGPATATPVPLRMLKGAREAANGMRITDEEIAEVLDNPAQVGPDPSHPRRSRVRGNGLTLVVGDDGMILRVSRKG